MANESRFTLFGMDSPADVRRRIGRTASEDAINLASVPRGRVGVAVAGLIGPALRKGFGIKSEEEQLAENRSQAMLNAFTRSEGNPTSYYKYLAQNLNDLGDASGAMHALEQYRSIEASSTAIELEKEKFRISEKRIDERSRLQIDKLELLRDQLDLKAEIDRKNSQIKALTAESSSNLNAQKVINLQNDIEVADTKLQQSAVKLRQADDRIDILRNRAATAQFDADTRRMKLGVDERIAKLRVSGKNNKATQKALEKAFNDYSAITKQKSFLDFARDLVKDDPELGAFFSQVDPDTMAALIRGEVQQEIGNARINMDASFNYNDAVERAVRRAASKYSTRSENLINVERSETNFPRSDSNFNLEEAQQLMNQMLQE